MGWFTALLVALFCCCSVPGRVLHVDNRESVPYTADDGRLRERVVRSLVRNRIIGSDKQITCRVNIMQIGNIYVVEVWPDGPTGVRLSDVRLRKPLLKPVGRGISRETAKPHVQ